MSNPLCKDCGLRRDDVVGCLCPKPDTTAARLDRLELEVAELRKEVRLRTRLLQYLDRLRSVDPTPSSDQYVRDLAAGLFDPSRVPPFDCAHCKNTRREPYRMTGLVCSQCCVANTKHPQDAAETPETFPNRET